MKLNDEDIDRLKHHEGVRNKPYRDVVGLWTVGVGHLMYPEQVKLDLPNRKIYPIKPEDNRKFTDEEVDTLLRADIRRFELGVLRFCPGTSSHNQFAALVSFAFNVGLGQLQRSTLRMKHNRGDIFGASREFPKWNKSGGKVYPGLVRRRADEMRLYLKQDS
jgi:GH24 family phage-related lysozyme (muramidase)